MPINQKADIEFLLEGEADLWGPNSADADFTKSGLEPDFSSPLLLARPRLAASTLTLASDTREGFGSVGGLLH